MNTSALTYFCLGCLYMVVVALAELTGNKTLPLGLMFGIGILWFALAAGYSILGRRQ